MNVTVNDVEIELPDNSTLGSALDARGIASQGIATALNGTLIPAKQRQDTVLSEGDKIIIIKAFYGG